MGLTALHSEHRVHPSQPTDWLINGLGGSSQSASGVNINEDVALTSMAFWAGVRFISETISSLPLHLYKRRQEKGKDRANDHYLYNLLHLKPNPEMTSMNYREAITGQVVTYGVTYSEIEKGESGRIKALWPLLSKNMVVKRIRGELLYYYTTTSGSEIIYPRDRILHIPGFSGNGLMGYNVVEQGKEAIGLNLALEEYANRFFGNNAKPPVVLQHPGQISEKGRDNLRQSWVSTQGGLDNAHRIAILEEGLQLKEFGVSPQDAQAIDARMFTVAEMARLLNLPPHILRDLSKSSFNNIEEETLSLVKYSLQPWLVRFEQNYTTQLLSDREQQDYFFEHLVDGLLRGDVNARWEAYTKGFQTASLSPNDIREMENKNPIEGGDVYYFPVNVMPSDKADAYLTSKMQTVIPEKKSLGMWDIETRGQQEIDKLKNRYKPLFKAAAQRVVDKEVWALKRAAKKHLTERDSVSFNAWLDKFYKTLPDDIRKSWFPVQRAFMDSVQSDVARMIGVSDEMAPELERWTIGYLDRFVERWTGRSTGQIAKILAVENPSEWFTKLSARFDEWNKKQAEKISNDEVVRQSNAISCERYRGAGVRKLKWRTRGDNCPFCRVLDGTVVGIDDGFFKDGSVLYVDQDTGESSWYDPDTHSYSGFSDKGSRPGVIALKSHGAKFHPPIHRNCNCIIIPE